MVDEKVLPAGWTKEKAEKYEKVTGEWPKNPHNMNHEAIIRTGKPLRGWDENDHPAYECRNRDDDGDFFNPYDPDGFGKD